MSCPFAGGQAAADATAADIKDAPAAVSCSFSGKMSEHAPSTDYASSGREPVYYHSYLGLDKVLEAQNCLSSTKAEEVASLRFRWTTPRSTPDVSHRGAAGWSRS